MWVWGIAMVTGTLMRPHIRGILTSNSANLSPVAFRQLAPISFWRLLCSSFVLFFAVFLLLLLLLLALFNGPGHVQSFAGWFARLATALQARNGFRFTQAQHICHTDGGSQQPSTAATIAATALQLVWLKSCLTVNSLPLLFPPPLNKVLTLPIAHCS